MLGLKPGSPRELGGLEIARGSGWFLPSQNGGGLRKKKLMQTIQMDVK